MDSYRILIKASAEKALYKLPFPHRRSLAQTLSRLKEDPRPAACEQLTRPGVFRIRGRGWRAVYTIDDEARVVRIVRIAHFWKAEA